MPHLRSPRLLGLVATAALALSACSPSAAPTADQAADTAAPTESTMPSAAVDADGSTAPSAPEEGTPAPAEPEPEPEPEPATESTPTQADEPATTAGLCDRAARDVTVTAVNFSFSTDTIGDLCSGDTVTLVVEEGSHSFTANSAGADTGVFAASEGSRTATIDAGPGTYNYVCSLHSQMNGELTVVG